MLPLDRVDRRSARPDRKLPLASCNRTSITPSCSTEIRFDDTLTLALFLRWVCRESVTTFSSCPWRVPMAFRISDHARVFVVSRFL